MFLANTNHLQGSLFNSEKDLNNTLQCILKNNWSLIFYEKVFKQIDEQDFKDMYDPIYGRVNFPVNILAALEIIKEMHSLTDEQLYESYHFNYLYQKAVGVENINHSSFTIRTLYNFRKSYCQHEKLTGINLFDQIFKDGRDSIIQDLGLNTSTQRTDSVMIGANIKRMNRLTLFHKVLSNLIKCVRKVDITISEELNSIISQEEDGYYYRLPKTMVQAKTEQLGNYIFIYVKRFENDSRVNKTKAFIDAKRVLDEQCTVRKDNKIELKERNEISSSSMQNPADTDATYRFKNKEGHRGYSTHATETCDKENPIQVITHVETVKNNVDDAKVLSESIETLKEETDLKTIIADGGYVSDDVRNVCDKENIDFIATAIRGKENEKELDSLSFELNENKLIEKCPNGEKPISQTLKADGTLNANFDSAKCAVCPLREKCIAYKSEKQSRIKIDTKRRWLDIRNAKLESGEYQSLCKMRPAVEGLMEKMKPKYLHGRTMFRGLHKVGQRMIMRAIGLNFKRYAAHILDLAKDLLFLFETMSHLTVFSIIRIFQHAFLQEGHQLHLNILFYFLFQVKNL